LIDAFEDCETIRLAPVQGRVTVWEFGFISPLGEYLWQIRPDMSLKDETSLKVGRFAERFTKQLLDYCPGTAMRMIHPHKPALLAESHIQAFKFRDALIAAKSFASEVADLAAGCHMWGSNPAFDVGHTPAGHLTELLHAFGGEPTWHYHPDDIPSVARGWCAAKGITPVSARGDGKIRSDDWSRAIGINPDTYDRHTALGDCRWVQATWDAMLGVEVAR
jgi:hypothetical protein